MNKRDSNNDLIFYGGDLNLEPCKENVGQYFLDRMKENHTKPALIDPVNNITYTHGDVRRLSIRCALEMKLRGLRKGEMVAIFGRNHNLNLVIPYLSAIYLGATVNPMHPDYSLNEIQRMTGLTQPRMIFCDEECYNNINKILQNLKISNCQIVIFERDFEPFIAHHGQKEEEEFHTTEVDVKNDLITIKCTSGSTGFIKGVMITHEIYYISVMQFIELTSPNQILLVYSPLSWVTASWTYGAIFLSGNARIITEYDPEKNIEIMSKYKIQWIFFTPQKLTEMIHHPKFSKHPEIVRNLKYIFYGGSAASKEQILEYRQIFKNAFLLNCYGNTEMHSGHARFLPNRDEKLANKKIFSHGKPIPGIYWKIVDPETGKVLGRNQPGELLVKGPTLTKGYYNDPEATSKAIDKDGWCHTGDIAQVDDDDCLYVVGRCKELFKYKGWQVSPAEIEQVIRTHPAVENVYVTGKPHETDGELPLAFVVKKPNTENVTENELIEYVNDRVSDIQKLRGGVIFIDTIPLTPAGKVRQSELRKLISET